MNYEYRAIIDNVEYLASDIREISEQNSLLNNTLEVGNVISARLDITVAPKTPEVPHKSKVQFFMRETAAGGAWLPRGTYYTHNFDGTVDRHTLSLECYDALLDIDAPFLVDGYQPAYPLAMQFALQQIAGALGAGLDSRNEVEPYFLTYEREGVTIRDVLTDIASAHACNIIITRNNEIRLVPAYKHGANHDIAKEAQAYSRFKPSPPVSGLAMGDGGELSFTFGDDSGTFITITNENVTQAMALSVFQKLADYEYMPFSAQKASISPYFELGDTVAIGGNAHPISDYRTHYSAGAIASDLGAPFSPPSGVGDLARAIGGGGTPSSVTLPVLHWDYNETPIRVGQTETQIASIDVTVFRGGNARGSFQLTFMSSRDCEAAIRIYDNEAQQLYTPIVRRIHHGFNEIGIPHSYILLREGPHTFSITMQVSEGWCNVGTRAAMFSVDLYATMPIAMTEDVRDLSLMQPEGALEPVCAYAIVMHEDEGGRFPIVMRARYMPGWRYGAADFVTIWEFDAIQGAKELAIEFNGWFELLSGNDKRSLVTQAKPWIFWTDNNDVLWGQYGDELHTRAQLATDVLRMSACRGWLTYDYPDNDMGLVVAYIKYEGIVAYRQLLGTARGSEHWDAEHTLDEAGEGNKSVHVQRLNDWRLCFAVQGADKLFVTEREYIASSLTPEIVWFEFATDDLNTIGVLDAGAPAWPYDGLVEYEKTYDLETLDITLSANFPMVARRPLPECIASMAPAGAIQDVVLEGGVLRAKVAQVYSEVSLSVKLGHIVLAYENGTFLNLPTAAFVWQKPPIEAVAPSETVEFNFALEQASIEVKPILPLEAVAPDETVEFHFALEQADIQVKPILEITGEAPAETVEFNFALEQASIEMLFVGTIPV